MAEGLFEKVYNPDVLSCLANLSNDEVFTPPEIANKMLDMLPQELFENPDTKFLDPACKSGVFLREIAKRLINGLEPQIPDLQQRIDHIYQKQLYGIAITELTSLMSRRSVYCTKSPQTEFSISQFNANPEGNIRFRRVPHAWQKGKCVFCGASQEEYDRSNDLETHAYEWIHTMEPEDIFKMKFDVVISNPPYQMSDGGNAASATPIYHNFVNQSKKLMPRYLTMIIPSRWFMGGRGLDSFRAEMLNDEQIQVIHDFPDASDCFPGVEIKGGVCYFLWQKGATGDCEVHSHLGKEESVSIRPLLEDGMDTFIRTDAQIGILKKVRIQNEETLDMWLNAGRFFGFHTKVEWDAAKEFGTIQTADGKSYIPMRSTRTEKYNTKVFIHGGECWVKATSVPKNQEAISQYKVIIPRAGNPGSSILGKPKLSEPGTCSSNTYVVAIPANRSLSPQEADNLIAYLKTKFVRYLVATKTSTQDMPPRAYEFVPLQDFSQRWTDQMLYEKYRFTEKEVRAIEDLIPAMEG